MAVLATLLGSIWVSKFVNQGVFRNLSDAWHYYQNDFISNAEQPKIKIKHLGSCVTVIIFS